MLKEIIEDFKVRSQSTQSNFAARSAVIVIQDFETSSHSKALLSQDPMLYSKDS